MSIYLTVPDLRGPYLKRSKEKSTLFDRMIIVEFSGVLLTDYGCLHIATKLHFQFTDFNE